MSDTELRKAARELLQRIRDALNEAHNNAYQTCCGRGGMECCGCPDVAWMEKDQRIMDALGPMEKLLNAALAASEQDTDAAQDLARVGQALIEVTAKMCPDWSPSECPSEIVSDLVNERDALRAALAEPEPSREPTLIQSLKWESDSGLKDAYYADEYVGPPHGPTHRFAALAYAAGHKAGNQSPTWQPIETAPKDESIILLGYTPHPRLEGSRRVYEGRWNVGQEQWTSTNGFMSHADATHWMPLPPPPKAGSGT
jgi:hypothetical protein